MTVEFISGTSMARYFRVSAGKDGGEPVTVRVGAQGVFACLTDLRTDCAHARAAEAWARAHPTEGR